MNNKQWHQDVVRDSKRLKEAERSRRSILVHTVFLGSLSVLFLVPLLAGAYLGHWLDSLDTGYTFKWTINLIILGLAIGVFNVYFFIRKYW
ncbi:AtpZ/AtpI family protein [Tolumonas lignilytica]|uniref:AtpZ/AtpI family protein n=1 Tax=Tolumonas lignilytica TaxID=1283284 RepID=UPI0004B0D2A5|nr:AtpZ/AtpI family protein [Tolumonas lignilytica]